MVYVALFRNLNLGHSGSPSRQQLLDAFAAADFVRSFQTNGTVLFDSKAPRETVEQARRELERAGYRDKAIIRSLDELRPLVSSTAEADPDERVYRTTLSFFDAAEPPQLELPTRSNNELVEIRRLHPGAAVAVCWQRGSTIGDVNALLERILGIPVTTRTLGTMQRLLAAAAQR
jgi:uncharacterized protein (DUF1697 family)